MSMHKIPLTPIEEAGLRAHGLDIGTPSQLSDAFRQGVRYASAQQSRQGCEAVEWQYQAPDGSWWGIAKSRVEEARLAGRPIRPLYTHPADQVAEGSRVVPVELLEQLAISSDCYDPIQSAAVEKLRALMEQNQ